MPFRFTYVPVTLSSHLMQKISVFEGFISSPSSHLAFQRSISAASFDTLMSCTDCSARCLRRSAPYNFFGPFFFGTAFSAPICQRPAAVFAAPVPPWAEASAAAGEAFVL